MDKIHIKGYMFIKGKPNFFETMISAPIELANEIMRHSAQESNAEGYLVTIVKEG